jgi:hypothetical protein
MTRTRTVPPSVRRLFAATVLAAAAFVGARILLAQWEPTPAWPGPTLVANAATATSEQVERTCGTCHATPAAELFPKDDWAHEVERGFRFLERKPVPPDTPSFASVVAYFRERAPEALSVLPPIAAESDCPVRVDAMGYRLAESKLSPGIADVHFVRLSDPRRLDVIACDMINGKVLLLRPYDPEPVVRVLSSAIPHPARAEVVDLNGDAISDLVVANLGSPMPTDARLGSVVWLRGERDGSYTPVTLASGLGRVADVQAADFDGDGDLDLIVAEFGWLNVGGVVHLENRSTAPGRTEFVATTIDPRHGAIHVPVADLNGDGRPDFVALISQEHETVVAFLNEGNHRFQPRTIHTAPHPAFGSSGIQLVDMDGDGDRDVLLSNGDSMDSQQLRPYHGVQWLENSGGYPFTHHRVASLYGAQRAIAGDIDNDGDMDIVAVAFLPGAYYAQLCREREIGSIVLLEQVRPGRFVGHALETVTCSHLGCDLGDFDADGRLDLVTGNAFIQFGALPPGDHSRSDWLTIRVNRGAASTGSTRPASIDRLR